MSKREVEAKFGRMMGMTASTKEWIEQETKNLEWYAFAGGKRVKGTKEELLKLRTEGSDVAQNP